MAATFSGNGSYCLKGFQLYYLWFLEGDFLFVLRRGCTLRRVPVWVGWYGGCKQRSELLTMHSSGNWIASVSDVSLRAGFWVLTGGGRWVLLLK